MLKMLLKLPVQGYTLTFGSRIMTEICCDVLGDRESLMEQAGYAPTQEIQVGDTRCDWSTAESCPRRLDVAAAEGVVPNFGQPRHVRQAKPHLGKLIGRYLGRIPILNFAILQ
ncbi:hypothetical protein CDAR_170651 [Caerostris darwini]|uniref:Uncharacterized protein n=1 Tax=Caerostris darwini TaxID=1538125 RepID=A0AAV4W6B7_9ARAC|nr:hypothetical protein CDAR_170651 [Caerostris darwini]